MKLKLIYLFVALFCCGITPLEAAIANVAGPVQAAAQTTPTTAGVNTTGADLLIAVTHDYQGTTAGVLSDSKSNTWIGLTGQEIAPPVRVRIFYATNLSAGNVGTAHTLTYTGTNYATITFSAWSGAHLTAPFDVQNGGVTTPSGVSLSTGSVTPTVNDCLIITGMVHRYSQTSVTVSAPFGAVTWTNFNGTPSTRGGAVAHEIQTTATARNATWTVSPDADELAAVIAVFKPASGGGGGGATSKPSLLILGVGAS